MYNKHFANALFAISALQIGTDFYNIIMLQTTHDTISNGFLHIFLYVLITSKMFQTHAGLYINKMKTFVSSESILFDRQVL